MGDTVPQTDDDDDDLPEAARLPAGTGNYMAPGGHRQMQEELKRLWTVERPAVVETVAWAAGNGDRSENGDYIYGKKRLREIDRRVRFLRKRLDNAEVVDPARQTNRSRVFFGATVTYETAKGKEHTVTIVGVDEADLARGQISWVSPVARALMKTEEGDVVELRTPGSRETLEVIAIRYPDEASLAEGQPVHPSRGPT